MWFYCFKIIMQRWRRTKENPKAEKALGHVVFYRDLFLVQKELLESFFWVFPFPCTKGPRSILWLKNRNTINSRSTGMWNTKFHTQEEKRGMESQASSISQAVGYPHPSGHQHLLRSKYLWSCHLLASWTGVFQALLHYWRQFFPRKNRTILLHLF